ncbi:MAG TPA: NUDIX hydrolase [Gemmatimonadaceae bacterium]
MPRSRARQEISAGGVVFRMEDGRPLFLLIRDSYDNWGFPKGHVERDEAPDRAAVREVQEETGLDELILRDAIDTIDWYFRFRRRLIHKVCHFYLMESDSAETSPQREEGITECSWLPLDEALERISYANARSVLERAAGIVSAAAGG